MRSQTASAWRPQEALSVAGAVALVERVNALRGAPVTASPLHFVMTTGDNTDNNARSELDWFLKAMSGGRISPNTGDPRHYEGVQNSGLPSTGSRTLRCGTATSGTTASPASPASWTPRSPNCRAPA